jgi:hypothetical protein
VKSVFHWGLLFVLLMTLSPSAKAEVPCWKNNLSTKAQRDACELEWKAAKCDEFFAQNPDKKEFARRCDPPDGVAKQGWGVIAGCAEGLGGAWWDLLKSLVNIPGEIWSYLGKNLDARTRFLDSCAHDDSCKRDLFFRATGREPTSEEKKKYLDTVNNVSGAYIWWEKAERHQATLRQVEQQKRAQKIQELQSRVPPGTPEYMKELEKIIPDAARQRDEDVKAAWDAIDGFWKKQQQKLECYDTETATEMVCYAIGSILDPTLAAGLAVKSVRLAKVLGKAAGAVGEAAQAAKAEKALGRALSQSQKDAVERAHLVGAGEVGKDGVNAAGVDNYTWAQLREKARILREAGFSEAETRKLMEAGIVGLESDKAAFFNLYDKMSPLKTTDQRTKDFRQAYQMGWLNKLSGEKAVLSYVDASGGRYAARFVRELADGTIEVMTLDGKVVKLSAAQMEQVRFASPENAKAFMDELAKRGPAPPAPVAPNFRNAPSIGYDATGAQMGRTVPTPSGNARFTVYSDESARAAAVARGHVIEHAPGTAARLQPGTYTYVVLKDGTVVTGRVEDSFEYGVKHLNLANKREVVTAGELKVGSDGRYQFNVDSGTYSKALKEKKGVPQTDLEARAAQALEATMRSRGQNVGRETLLPTTTPPTRERLIGFCRDRVFAVMPGNAAACCQAVGLLCN